MGLIEVCWVGGVLPVSAVRVAGTVVGRREGVGDLVLYLVWGEAGEAGLVRLQVEQVHVSSFSTISLYCSSVSPEQAL